MSGRGPKRGVRKRINGSSAGGPFFQGVSVNGTVSVLPSRRNPVLPPDQLNDSVLKAAPQPRRFSDADKSCMPESLGGVNNLISEASR